MTEITNPVANTNGTGEHPVANNVRPTDIINEMQDAYLDYAMSVIVARALPDVRDGLKPVHRRILYAMYQDLGLTHDKPHKKSARIVGEVLGKYHPHGDTAVYDAMVRMAQDFSLRYPLIDGQGNFGSIDGDNAAAMRYTEARLAEISNLMLDDLDKDTVNWHGNFDNSLREPDILPAALPNLLINGSSGIAVGMATNIPPHNLGEVVDALAYMIDHYQQVEEIPVEQLTHFIQGPDFPTGGILYRFREDAKGDENMDAIAQGYSVGKSRLVLQAKAHFEEMSRGRMRIVITELPYQTNKVSLLERIAELVRDEKIVGITDLRDESDRTGMRIVIELTRNVDPKDILADLFKYTPLQQTFGMQMLALVEGQPRTLSLKRLLHLFIQHREEIIRRRSEFELARAKERAHILEGLLRALDILDEVIHTIRNSQRVDTARTNLMKNFDFTEIQAQAILDMQLRRLAALERKRLQDEYKELQNLIKHLEDLLAHPEKILALIKEDLLRIKEKYGDARRTQIVDRTKGTLTTTDLLPDQQVWVALSADGELRRHDVTKIAPSTLRQIGKRSEVAILTANTRDYLYLFTKDGRCSRVAVHEIPQDGSAKHLGEFCKFGRRDIVTAAVTLPRGQDSPSENNGAEAKGYLFFATEQGEVKRITLADFLAVAHTDPTVMGVGEKDRLGWAFVTRGKQEVLLVSAEGQAIRFNEEDVRSMGLAAGGVGGIKLKSGDTVVYAAMVDPEAELITMTAQGFAKRSPLTEYPAQGRNGGGVVTHKPTSRTGNVTTALFVKVYGADDMVIPITKKGAPKPLALTEIPVMGRAVQGKLVTEISGNDTIAYLKQLVDPTQLREVAPKATDDDQDKAKVGAKTEPKAAKPVARSNGASTATTPRPTLQTPLKMATAKSDGAQAKSNAAPAEIATQKTPSKPELVKNEPVKAAPPKQRDAKASTAGPEAQAVKTLADVKTALTSGEPRRTQVETKPVENKVVQLATVKSANGPAPLPLKVQPAQPAVQEKKAAPQPARTKVAEDLTQPALFATEIDGKPASERMRPANKVQTVVSVPANQANKGKKAR
ncbi:MAG: DNA gyrase subunit A [Caldilineaceae bacterium]